MFNEPGNSNRKSMSLPHMMKFFEIIRNIDPIQPLTVGIWSQTINFDNLLDIEKIGCYCWGFVAGKYQTYEPHNSVWYNYKDNPDAYLNWDFDFSKWFHDLYRPSLNPYVPKEIYLIKKFSALADKDFAASNENTSKSKINEKEVL